MKTSFRTIKIALLAILITYSFSLAQESSGGNSEPVFPERPVKNEMESDAAYMHKLNQWQAEIRRIAANANTEISLNNPSLPKRPVKRDGESDASFNNRLNQWEAEIRSITEAARLAKPETSSNTPNLPARPTKRIGESDTSFNNRTRQWASEIRRLTASTPVMTNSAQVRRIDGTTNLPPRPEKREGESDSSFRNRLNQWDAEVRRITENTNSGTSTDNSDIPERPARREGESTSSYQNRVSAWEAEVKLITNYKKQNNNELDKLRQELARLSEKVTSSIKTGSYNNTKPENISVIPMGEIETEKLLTINEDLKIMSQILKNELNQQSKSVEWIFKDGKWLPINPKTGTTPINANILNNMYLEGYGALFEMNVNFPLSVPYKELQSEEFQKEKNDDSVWERTKQQILEPQSSSNPYSRAVHEKPEILYDSEDVEKIKTSLIKTLKYASNIRALEPYESVVLKLMGAGGSIKVVSVNSNIDNSKLMIEFERDGIRQVPVVNDDLNDFIKSISAPTALVIKAKKTDIDAFEKDELDFNEFREKVKIFSYPIISSN